MAKHPIKKLALKTEVLRSLTADELLAIVGGDRGRNAPEPGSRPMDGRKPPSIAAVRGCPPVSDKRPCFD